MPACRPEAVCQNVSLRLSSLGPETASFRYAPLCVSPRRYPATNRRKNVQESLQQ